MKTKYYFILFFLAAFIVFGVGECFSAGIKDYDRLMQEASELRRGGESEKAEVIYDDILSQNPDDTDALVGRGFCRLRNRKHYDAALVDFEMVIKIAPKYVDAYLGKATIYRRQGQFGNAKSVLLECKRVCEGDKEKMQYLATSSWREGFVSLARQLDREYPPEDDRKLLETKNEISLYYIYDWVDDRPDWEESGMVFNHKFRPDISMNLSHSAYRRNSDNDYVFGAGFAYRYNYYLTLEYQSYYAQEGEFLADQKHRPRFSFRLPTSTILSSGINLDKYSSDWAKVGILDVKQYFGLFYVDYTLQSGEDNFGQGVITHVGKLGYERDEKYSLYFGYSTGDESLDFGSGSSFSSQQVETFFGNIRYFFGPRWGVTIAGGREYRDNDFYRDTAALSLFTRF